MNNQEQAAAYEHFDYKYYAQSTGQDVCRKSKKQFWKEFLARESFLYRPVLWFDPAYYRETFGSECQQHPFVDFFVQPRGIQNAAPMSENDEIVVSLTTHGKRIHTVWLAIESIMRQTLKPHKIVLWLVVSEFYRKELPASLKILQKRGLTIEYSKENYKAATKLLPSVKKFHNKNIITIDDDRIYHPTLIEELWKQHLIHPNCIVSPHVRKFVFDKSKGGIDYLRQQIVYPKERTVCDLSEPLDIHPYGQTESEYGPPLFGIFEGFSGVLYPPKCLGTKVLADASKIYPLLTPCADDIWYQVHAILNGTKSVSLPQLIADTIFNAPEIPCTQESALWHDHLYANGMMAYRALSYYNLLDVVQIPKYDKLQCETCRRFIEMPSAGHIPTNQQRWYKHEMSCPVCFSSSKKVVLCIGCYDYGNIGDHLYQLLWHHFYKDNFELHFIPDSIRINKKGEYIEFQTLEDDLEYDALIIGGGGILRNIHKETMMYYIEQAIDLRKTLIFASVGLQTTIKNPTVDDAKKILNTRVNGSGNRTILETLRAASLIWVRSPQDYRLLNPLISHDCPLFVYPDLGYLATYILPTNSSPEKKYVTLIQTGSATVLQSAVRHFLNQKLSEYPGSKLMVMNWGGEQSVDQDLQLVTEYFANATVLFGDSLSEKLLKLRRYLRNKKSDLQVQSALRIIMQSHHVVTGRYHGLVVARSFGIPCTVMDFSYKLNSEKEYLPNPNLALNGIQNVRNFIENNGVAIPKPQTCSDDLRNQMIVKVDCKFRHKIEISKLQSLSNNQLYYILVFGKSIAEVFENSEDFDIVHCSTFWTDDERNQVIVQLFEKHEDIKTLYNISHLQQLSNQALWSLSRGLPNKISGYLYNYFNNNDHEKRTHHPDHWSDADRNDMIIKLYESNNEKIFDLSFIQAMDNHTIYKQLVFKIDPIPDIVA